MYARTVLSLSVLLTCSVGADYGHYIANETFTGKTLRCTEAEKSCLRYSKLLDPSSGKCYPLGWGPSGCPFFVRTNSGTKTTTVAMRGQCLANSCKPFQITMAHDGACYYVDQLMETVCSKKRHLRPAYNIYGEGQCVCYGKTCEDPPIVQQPEEVGLCAVPNFELDPTMMFSTRWRTAHMKCSEEQRECFMKDNVLYGEECYKLLSQGPCKEGEALTLKRNDKNKVEVECARNRCPENQCMTMFDRKCHGKEEVQNVLCAGLNVYSNAFGECYCGKNESIRLSAVWPLKCAVQHETSQTYRLPCSSLHPSLCPLLKSPRRFSIAKSRDWHFGLHIPCSTKQSECFADGAVYFPKHSTCYKLLSQGPCEDNSRVILDKAKATEGILKAKCAKAEFCPEGERLLEWDGNCHSEEAIRTHICPGFNLFSNAFGETICEAGIMGIALSSHKTGTCNFQYEVLMNSTHQATKG